ncbi:hypothetical protein W97_07115 [Coniosporium apollinis CBS 100218]|uniref:Uncharacterized protein n=1 Tax=Coniosporium apollinis (strain CBS 100218) TaxID=1168221 RepID=R7Z1P6_CONA1|nr:uncharacterized protein W97_07115 [Coniosporium apollinis CBS 100218]EON67969.1 hypothetical protein W97_07115 [Coniosporium apollinis CBS 100218]
MAPTFGPELFGSWFVAAVAAAAPGPEEAWLLEPVVPVAEGAEPPFVEADDPELEVAEPAPVDAEAAPTVVPDDSGESAGEGLDEGSDNGSEDGAEDGAGDGAGIELDEAGLGLIEVVGLSLDSSGSSLGSSGAGI